LPLGQGPPDARGDLVERFVPAHPLPAILTAFSLAAQRIENPIRIVRLIQRGRALGAIASARSRMFGIALVLADLQRLAVDVGEQAARGLAVEAGGRNEHVVALDAPRPGPRIELGPVVPAL